jgi:hypothetical protein
MNAIKPMTFAMGLLLLAGCGEALPDNDPPQVLNQLNRVREAAGSVQNECLADADCGANAACEQFCGNGWCGNVCIGDGQAEPAGDDCRQDSDCDGQMVCQQFCGNGWCANACVAAQVEPAPNGECRSDADCAQNETCNTYCGNGWCASVCIPARCSADSDCDPDAACVEGACVIETPQDGCLSDSDCATGQFCQTLCGNGWCDAACVPEESVDPIEACTRNCAVGACAPGNSCWSDGQDYLCNDCVAACHGAAPVDCG